jgi:DNA-damage-inducible protein D
MIPSDGSSGATIFEQIRRQDNDGSDFWSSRDLARILDYVDYRNFEQVLAKAKQACLKSGQPISDHFVDVNEMVDIGSSARREVNTAMLSRYACYLLIQNANPTKEVVALGQTYFAIQTRRQELSDESSEDERRIMLREEMKQHNLNLAGAAKGAGVIEPIHYAIFQNHGYEGLYGGLDQKGIHARKGLKKSQQILDHMGSTELAANLFRATQTEEKLRREGIRGRDAANRTHREVGAKVRQTIKELGGTMPEALPVRKALSQSSGESKSRRSSEPGKTRPNSLHELPIAF